GSATIYNWIGTGNGPCSSGVLQFGTEEQKRKYVPPVATGQVKGAFALTEPGAGSDASGLKTKAVIKGDKFIINGSKTFITMASKAKDIFTIARIIENGEDKGFGAILVPRDSVGISMNEEDKMGQHGTPLNEIGYQDVEVPVENLVGKVGEGMKVAMSCLNEIRTNCGALSVGLAQEAIDEAVTYSKERMQFGKRISEFQNTQFVLAECQTKVNAARLLVYQSASILDAGKQDRMIHSMAKYYAGEVCNDVVRKCLQVFGGYGYMKDYPIERIFRDAKITEIYDGTAEIHKVIISKCMGVR
ncbi:MAG: acyl-CoA dehydrogenase family protein, partial [Firmicutes bacterium]|nr:acyl-CoA dehydrogenase family protein [Bacillota bacterium]